MFDVSIIIVSWNAKKYLNKCLQSIYRTTHNLKFEVIVVDNDSGDGSPEMVKRNFSQVNLISTGSNLGFAKANNIGIKESNGHYIVLMNSDVEILDNCLEIMYSYIDKHSSIGILGPKVLNPDKTLQRSFKKFPTLWNTLCRACYLDKAFPGSKLFGGALMTFFSGESISNVDVLIGAFWLIKREALDNVGLLDENFFMYSEDKDWCRRFRNAGWNVVYFPDAEIIHYGGGSSANAPIRFNIEQIRANLQYWKKHHRKFSQVVFYLNMILLNLFRLIGYLIIYVFFPSKRRNNIHKIRRFSITIYWLLKNSGFVFKNQSYNYQDNRNY